jgi:hypothetical protein
MGVPNLRDQNGKELLAAAGNLVVEAARETELVPGADVALERRAG